MEELLNLTTMQAVVLMGSVSAAVEIARRAVHKDWHAVIIIATAGIIGGLVGTLYCGLEIPEGVIYGLSATGLFNFAQNVGSHISAPGKQVKKGK